MELAHLIYKLENDRDASGRTAFDRLTQNQGAQFGVRPEQFLGASILPEKSVEGNMIEAATLRYRSIIANDAARYSPVQLKEGAAMYGSMVAKLAESDVGKEFTAQQYDEVRKLLKRGGTMQAAANFLSWLDTEVNQALLRLNEKHRWGAIVDGVVTRVGDNGYSETVTYPNPSGHRVTIAASWETKSSGVNTNDPMTDIFAIMRHARNDNLAFARVIMSNATQFQLLENTLFQDRARFGAQGFIPPNANVIRGIESIPDVAAVFQRNGLPSPEIFDGTYHDNGTKRYLPEGKIVFICQTGRTRQIDPEPGETFYLENTVGYTAVGSAAGQDSPGRVLSVDVIPKKKPPRIEVEGYQTSLPIIESPEHIYVLDTVI
jgi:hypothetical protein